MRWVYRNADSAQHIHIAAGLIQIEITGSGDALDLLALESAQRTRSHSSHASLGLMARCTPTLERLSLAQSAQSPTE